MQAAVVYGRLHCLPLVVVYGDSIMCTACPRQVQGIPMLVFIDEEGKVCGTCIWCISNIYIYIYIYICIYIIYIYIYIRL
jgi:hypothetical protein